MRRLLCSVLAGFFVCIATFISPARAAEPVDLLLVLAADVSRSVDSQKFQLQRAGYAAAISDRRVLDAITAGRHKRIAVQFVEWSGFGNHQVVVDWTLIDGPKTAQNFGDRLLELPRTFADRTSISGGIDFAVTQFARAPFTSERRTIDVSGRRHQQFGPRRHQGARRRQQRGHHHQRAGDPQRKSAAVESRTHPSAGRTG